MNIAHKDSPALKPLIDSRYYTDDCVRGLKVMSPFVVKTGHPPTSQSHLSFTGIRKLILKALEKSLPSEQRWLSLVNSNSTNLPMSDFLINPLVSQHFKILELHSMHD